MVFFNGFGRQRDANGYDIDYMLTDDLDEMFALNGDNATWLLTNDETIGNRRIAYRYNSLPDFSRYYTNGIVWQSVEFYIQIFFPPSGLHRYWSTIF